MQQPEPEPITLVYLRRLASQRTAPAPDPMPPVPLVATPATRSAREKPRLAQKGKSVCSACARDVYMVEIEQRDGSVDLVAMDPEIMTGAEYPKGRRRVHFRRVHSERCATYQLDNDKKAKRDRWRRQMAGG